MSKKGGKAHKLSDGSLWTAYQIAEATGLTVSTIRCRLLRTKDVTRLFCTDYGKHKYKTYTLSDGSQWTIKEIMAHTGITAPTAGARVHKSLDVKRVLAPAHTRAINERKANNKENMIKSRMCYDQRDHWLLLANIGRQA